MTSAATRLSRVSAAIAATAIALTAASALAGGFIKFGDIKGESRTSAHGGGQIEIESWSWGESHAKAGVGASQSLSVGSARTEARKKGNVEYEWKVEEGEKAAKRDMTLKGSKIGENAAVEREMKESGEKGGTEDINIGVGELQEMTISKSMDSAAPTRSRAHDKRTTWVARSTPAPRGSVRVKVKTPWLGCRVGARYPVIALGDGARVYQLHGAVVASCSGDADDRPTEEVAFYYNKISF